MTKANAETVYYIAPYDRISIVHKEYNELWETPEEYTFEINGKPEVIPNRLGLIRCKINKKNWNKALKKKWIVKLGRL